MVMASPNAVIKVFLVNGETRSVPLDDPAHQSFSEYIYSVLMYL